MCGHGGVYLWIYGKGIGCLGCAETCGTRFQAAFGAGFMPRIRQPETEFSAAKTARAYFNWIAWVFQAVFSRWRIYFVGWGRGGSLKKGR